jgi:hypothetical protein
MPDTQPVIGPRPLGNIWPGLTKQEILALKSLGAGVANEGQQKTALEAIVKKFAGYYELTFHDENERLSAFGEGRRFVGACIQEALTTPTSSQSDPKP